jgi:hypothetical protein
MDGMKIFLKKNLNTHRASTHDAVTSPNAIIPEQVLRHHRSAAGLLGGQALSSPSSNPFFVFHMSMEIILQSPYFIF